MVTVTVTVALTIALGCNSDSTSSAPAAGQSTSVAPGDASPSATQVGQPGARPNTAATATQAAASGAPATASANTMSAGAAPAAASGAPSAGAAGASASGLGSPAQAGASGMSATTPATAASAAGSAGSADHGADEPMLSCPSAGSLMPGDSTRQVMANDRMRSYLMHVPRQYQGDQPVPLVFDFHGYSSNPQQQMGGSGFRELADQENFIVVYPEGVGASWHVNGCCGTAGQMKLDEIAFVRAIFEAVTQDACIDPNRVYASGISQGGGMAHHVACLAADIFSGVAPVSSDLRTDPCEPVRPVTEISFRGLADSLDAYEGGHVGPPGMEGYTAIGAKPTLERWKTIDGCSGSPEMMNDLCETYSTCEGGVAVSLCSIPGADHVLYQNAQGLSVPKVAWELFMKHPRQ